MTKPREIGLLFTPENLRLVASGCKTQTRRGNKLEAINSGGIRYATVTRARRGYWSFEFEYGDKLIKCPYGDPKSEPTRYYLKEAVRVLRIDDSNIDHITADIHYPADGILRQSATVTITPDDYKKLLARVNWRETSSPMFMLKSFARHWVEGVRTWPERLGNMSAEDAIAEGIEQDPLHARVGMVGSCEANYWRDYLNGGYDLSPVQSYASLWNSINGKGSWDAEKWVWCVEWLPPAVVGEAS